uniref:Transmembrane protein 216 n=1 Tax=Phocoena sinus TaxID=42100 RepID=A0A8C9BBS0_PHOSS
ILFLYLGIGVIRLFFGTKGNLCQRKMPLAISVALTFPSAMMASYYLLLQTYVLLLEAVMNGISLFFCDSELLLEVLTLGCFLHRIFMIYPRTGVWFGPFLSVLLGTCLVAVMAIINPHGTGGCVI